MLNNLSNESLRLMLILAPILLFSIAVHEFAHAYVAYKLGDISQKNNGRLTLDPFTHMSWLGFISLLLIGIGWGKPVEVNTRNFKKPSRDLMLTSIAGPISNLILAFLFSVILKILYVLTSTNLSINAILMNNNLFIEFVVPLIQNAIVLNVFLALFNLLPLPPFDGGKVLEYFLPYKWKGIITFLERNALIIFLVLVITDIHMYIIGPLQGLILTLLQMFIY